MTTCLQTIECFTTNTRHHLGPVIPGALAVAASPAAALFGEDDWSWHRNPAAAIRSGGTNKQTPVWKYFVYSKSENLSRSVFEFKITVFDKSEYISRARLL